MARRLAELRHPPVDDVAEEARHDDAVDFGELPSFVDPMQERLIFQGSQELDREEGIAVRMSLQIGGEASNLRGG